ncbi:hypothetical protein EXIGLDRAFT_332515 [Exidia glandulosa HHB12029]|uniref:Uncharacterized protein n=1 Tax=Exidia glandulosa HHB12029 TaxID=1314781 RepID=A0A165LLC5_EXIGL|nr:hypothetical protein EXIGLDRAFT_332515 [Exidia glandulosa HHB12029]
MMGVVLDTREVRADWDGPRRICSQDSDSCSTHDALRRFLPLIWTTSWYLQVELPQSGSVAGGRACECSPSPRANGRAPPPHVRFEAYPVIGSSHRLTPPRTRRRVGQISRTLPGLAVCGFAVPVWTPVPGEPCTLTNTCRTIGPAYLRILEDDVARLEMICPLRFAAQIPTP